MGLNREVTSPLVGNYRRPDDLTNESANKAEINILSARDTTRPGP